MPAAAPGAGRRATRGGPRRPDRGRAGHRRRAVGLRIRRLRGRGRTGPTARRARVHAPGHAAGLVRAVRRAGSRAPAGGGWADRRRLGRDRPLASHVDADRARAGRQGDPGTHHRRGHVPVQPDRADVRLRGRGPLPPVPGPGAGPAGGLQRLSRPRPFRRCQCQPRVVLRAPRRRGAAPSHEGDSAARTGSGRGPAPGPPAALQHQGASGERHDRRSHAQRHRPCRGGRQRGRARAVHGRALRDRAPAHLRRHGSPPTWNRPGGAVLGALPLRLGHGSAQGEFHGDHPVPGTRPPRRLLRSHRLGGATGRAGSGPLQRGHPDRCGGHVLGGGRVRHRRRHHLGVGGVSRARRGPRQGRGPGCAAS